MSRTLNLTFDQTAVGLFSRLAGRYSFTTEDITLGNYEIRFETHLSVAEPDKPAELQRVTLLHNHKSCLSFKIEQSETGTLLFEIEKDQKFDFLSFCILFKFFYQHAKNKLGCTTLNVRTERFRCYMFQKIFGFQLIRYHKGQYTMKFDSIDSFQHIWDEFYGTKIEENLYNFLLPVDAGGFVPSNVLARENSIEPKQNTYRVTERRLLEAENPLAEIKIGYNLYEISINDLSETGLSFNLLPVDDDPHNDLPQPDLTKNHCYSVRIRDPKLRIEWSHVIVQILWSKGSVFGARIVEHQTDWTKTISNLKIKDFERLTFGSRKFSVE